MHSGGLVLMTAPRLISSVKKAQSSFTIYGLWSKIGDFVMKCCFSRCTLKQNIKRSFSSSIEANAVSFSSFDHHKLEYRIHILHNNKSFCSRCFASYRDSVNYLSKACDRDSKTSTSLVNHSSILASGECCLQKFDLIFVLRRYHYFLTFQTTATYCIYDSWSKFFHSGHLYWRSVFELKFVMKSEYRRKIQVNK